MVKVNRESPEGARFPHARYDFRILESRPVGQRREGLFGLKIRNLRGSCRRRRNFITRITRQTPQFITKNPSRRCPLGLYVHVGDLTQG